ncbi:MAG: LysE family translocator [Candidatus Halichondribacter symbioticus]
MSVDLISLLGFVIVSLWTPGPNNTLIALSAARFGFRRSLPHMVGVAFGFAIMSFLIAFGLGAIFQQSWVLREAVRWTGIVILLWLCWRIATASAPNLDGKTDKKPWGFLQAAAFQWINPKAWVMAISVTSQFVSPDAPLRSALVISGMFAVLGCGSSAGWGLFGSTIVRWLKGDWQVMVFNLVMAGLLLFSIVLIVVADL